MLLSSVTFNQQFRIVGLGSSRRNKTSYYHWFTQ